MTENLNKADSAVDYLMYYLLLKDTYSQSLLSSLQSVQSGTGAITYLLILLRITSGPRVKLVDCKSALNPHGGLFY